MITKNNKFKLIYFIAIFFALVSSSCSNWLDVSPKSNIKGEDLLKNETGFRDILIGSYSLMNGSNSYGRALTYEMVDVLAQYYWSPTGGTTAYGHDYEEMAEYKYKEDMDVESRINGVWSTAFEAIVNINYAMQFIDERADVFSTPEIHQVYKGEMIALRAMLHFDMLRLFAPAPAMDGGNGLDAPAIPFIDKYTSSPQVQLTVKEVIERIASELIEAKELMRDGDPFGPMSETVVANDSIPELFHDRQYRMNYYATSALLARVYAYAGAGYEDMAYQAAKGAIDEINSKSSKMVTFTVTGASQENPFFKSEVLFMLGVNKLEDLIERFFTEGPLSGHSFLSISNDGVENIFNVGGTSMDFRENYWLKSMADGASKMVNKYYEQEEIPLIKLSELYLIAAEYAPEVEKLAYINKLRYHRGLQDLTVTTDIKSEIYKEYRREFIGEGQLFYYYKRNLATEIGAEDNVEISDIEHVYNLPIPLLELDFGNIKVE